jgi:D-arabinose 1-dehydrogenase-like Zn-dependent alcohol dehydrogenase
VKGFCAFSKDTAQEFVKFAEANELKPVIAKVFEFRDMVEAFEVMQNPTAVGKFVIKISE